MIGGLVWDPDDRADLVQETFYRAYKALDRFDPEARFRPWLITIAMNAARDHLRARRRRTMVSLNEADEDETPLELTDPGPRPDEEAIGRVAAETCEGAFRTLPEAARVILWLRVREELSYDEIAQVLDVPTGTVMSRLSRARTALRRALAEGSAEGTDREVQQDVADCRPDTAAERRAPGASP
jgi:RNA polymerase sigma-70 factor (ECF subfamily)